MAARLSLPVGREVALLFAFRILRGQTKRLIILTGQLTSAFVSG